MAKALAAGGGNQGTNILNQQAPELQQLICPPQPTCGA
jgi:hypothetical protein